jgi:hypothetical protein|tara:strand:- start:1211 stop:1753 length:543 start_codon:yes stop_codon:yes gene_type:complete
MKVLCFTSGDELKEIDVPKGESVPKVLSQIDDRSLKRLHSWRHENITLECYGCDVNDKKQGLNSHELPKSDTIHTLYGDIYLTQKINDISRDLDISQYGMLSYYIHEKYDNVEDPEYNNDMSDDEDNIDELDDTPIGSDKEIISGKKITPKKILTGKKRNKETIKNIINVIELEYDKTEY